MGFYCGIIGFPNVGKSTIFNALSNAGAHMANYPFCTIEPNRSTVAVPDGRLRKIAELYQKKNPIPTVIEIVDVAGLVEGASRGEGLGNQFLGHIRTVDALVHVVRCFHDEDVSHVPGQIHPKNDIDIINTELIFADLQVLERALLKTERLLKSGDKKVQVKTKILHNMIEHLNSGNMLRSFSQTIDDRTVIVEYGLITSKPVLYLANLDEDDFDSELAQSVKDQALKDSAAFMCIAGKIEEEIAELPNEDKLDFLEAMGLKQSSLDRLIETTYKLLNIITFYTTTTDIQAWTIQAGSHAASAAEKIHTDFEKKFIRAEVFHYNDLIITCSEQTLREKGLIRTEGRDYSVQDGDVIHFLI